MSANNDNVFPSHAVYDAADFGRAVRTLRNHRGWSQSTLAEWLGVHRVTISKLEQGGTVDLPVAIRALGILGATVTIHPRGTVVQIVGRADE